MSKFGANVFLIRTTSNYFWASEVCKNQRFYSWQFCSFNIFGAKIEISVTNWVEKTPISFFSTFGSKINKVERKKLEISEKITKTQKLEAITLNILVSQIFLLENQNNQFLLLWFLKVHFTQKMLVKWSKCHTSKPFFLLLKKLMNGADRMSIFSFFCISKINLQKACSNIYLEYN